MLESLPRSSDPRPPAIEFVGIDKRFGAVHANRDIDLTILAGSIHGLVGENGAGKSTLMSILYGFYQADRGEIRIDGNPAAIRSSADAIRAGIGMVHQQFMLVDTMTVLENVLLGAEGSFRLRPAERRARAALAKLASDYELWVDPDAVVGELSVGEQQRVEILKTLYRGAEILILDEPTAVLTPAEVDHLFRILRRLQGEGKTVVVITHKLKEIKAVTDRVSVMRKGEIVATLDTADTTVETLAEAMVGRRVLLQVSKGPSVPGAVELEVARLTVRDKRGLSLVDDVSFTVRAGEIVGIAGVAGNGQSELLEAIAGIRRADGGSIRLGGRAITALDPAEIRTLGIAHIPEDRHRMGLVLNFSAEENVILGYQDDPAWSSGWLYDRTAIRAAATRAFEDFDVRPPDPLLRTALFSGGNQQKIVVAREIGREPRLLLVGQPTRGVDIGAIEAIHRRLIDLRDRGRAILLVSAELDEIRSLADRVLCMCQGRITGECRPEASETEIGMLMAGLGGDGTARGGRA
ncbi:ABC transporter ATP-binding protein [Siculibacillus lacustris]|uniref:ABC transporter ATP-binding protein n=1 Tax=Siculibacillus lacustris TaxID=1549641 RepID=A0A4Q9VVZ2_9HYPH|nr:ABC transporter ATP-binding protein [Siculibacillus lacustris]TBW39243.1 ABC transporter ATP-binding protein [Siculibacillus lacustris]